MHVQTVISYCLAELAMHQMLCSTCSAHAYLIMLLKED